MSRTTLWKLAFFIGLGLSVSVLAVIDPTKPIILASMGLIAAIAYLEYRETTDGKTSYLALFAGIFLIQRLNSLITPQAGELIGLFYGLSLAAIVFSLSKIYQLSRA